jgi:hypothetical protein
MSHIVVSLEGGLGNQMFQYAAGRAAATRLRLPLKLDLQALRHRGHRPYGLNVFRGCAGLPIVGGEGWGGRMLARLRGQPLLLKEAGFAVDERILSFVGPARLEGYFQSERYFADYASAIRRDFTPCEQALREIDALAAALLPSGPSISLHVRRADYTTPEAMATHGIMGPDYYERALRLAAERAGSLTVCVFSDDPAWARANLVLPPDTRFISEHTRFASQDLILMSRCAHHITANSSFSWWGAWLNPSADKFVITPHQWFQPSTGLDTKDLRPPGWLLA